MAGVIVCGLSVRRPETRGNRQICSTPNGSNRRAPGKAMRRDVCTTRTHLGTGDRPIGPRRILSCRFWTEP